MMSSAPVASAAMSVASAAMSVAAPAMAMSAPMVVMLMVVVMAVAAAKIISAGIIDAPSPYPAAVGVRAIEPDAVIKTGSIPSPITIVIIPIVLVDIQTDPNGGKRRAEGRKRKGKDGTEESSSHEPIRKVEWLGIRGYF
jgi:hypothetical protein